MIEYMRVDYSIRITKPNQPLLFANFKDQRMYLPTEFCHEAALPDNFTQDARKMRDLDEYKIKSPNERFHRITEVLNRIVNSKEFAQFEILLDCTEHKVQSKVLHPPVLVTDRGKASWNDYAMRKIKHSDPVQLDEEAWTLVYAADNYDRANKALDNMKQACRSFGIKVSDPDFIEVPVELAR